MVIRSATLEEIKAVAAAMHYDPSMGVRSVAFVEHGSVKACILYDHWTYNSVNVHVYSKAPKYLFNPVFIREMFKYPFETLGRGLLITVTPENATESLAVSRVLGFKETYRVKDGWRQGVDQIVKEMRREECKWLQKEAA